MKYEIQNKSGIGKAFKVYGGLHEVKNNTVDVVELEHDLNPEQIEAYRRNDVIITPLDRRALAERERAAAKAKADAEAERLEAERKAAEEAAAKAKEARDALVARAAELKVEHAADIDDEALKALVAAAEANAAQPGPAAGK